jgi:hypothetical protein
LFLSCSFTLFTVKLKNLLKLCIGKPLKVGGQKEAGNLGMIIPKNYLTGAKIRIISKIGWKL